MLSHIATDLQQVYLEEVFTPQLGKPGASTPAKPKSSSDIDGDGDVDSFEKNVRQVVYDVHHIMKRDKVPAEKAFELRSSKTNYSAEVIKTAKEKLGIIGGSSTSVSEEILSEDDKVGIVVNYKNGTTYRKSVSRDSVQTELQKFRSNLNVSSVEQTRYGLRKRDPDGDRKIESPSKEHAGVVHNAIQRATGGTPDGKDTRGKKKTSFKKKLKSYGVSEGFSNWREDLKEVVSSVSDEISSRKEKQITEKPVNNYKDKIVVINPTFNEKNDILGGTILEAFELNEEYLNEAVDIATEFFYNCGLNENGVDIVIEELGEETFSEFVFELSEEYFLSEELKKSESKVKTSKAPKGTKQYATTIARVKKQGGTTMSAKDRIGSTIRKDGVKKAVDKAKETQAPSPSKGKKPVRDAIARGIFGIAKAYQKGMERHRAATQTAGKALKVAGKGAKEFAGGVKSGVEATVDATKKIKKAVVKEDYYDLESKSVKPGKPGEEQKKTIETLASKARTKKKTRTPVGTARRGSDTFKPSSPEEAEANKKSWGGYWSSAAKGYREEYDLLEKSESEQQQKLFGLALSVKRGETPRSEASAEVLKIVDSMSEKKIRDFASTPHSEVPKKVTEAIARVRPNRRTDTESRQRETRKIQTDNAREKIGEDMDSFATADPKISSLNVRIARLKALNDPNKEKLLKTMITQQQRLELQASTKKAKQSKVSEPQVQNQSYQPEGELVDEARAEERRGLGSTGTQRQRQKTGVVTPSGQVAHPATSYSGGQNPHLRGKKGRTKEQRREGTRRYLDQPGGIYAEPENKQGEGKYSKMQAKKRDQSYMSTKGT